MQTIDEYLQNVDEPNRSVLNRIRDIVHKVAPEAEETISYDMPTFKYKNKPLIHFAAFKDHLSIFPVNDRTVGASVDKKVEKYRSGKSTLQFTPDNPIPDALIEEIVKNRMHNIIG